MKIQAEKAGEHIGRKTTAVCPGLQSNPAVKQVTATNYYLLSPELLQEGKTWYWRITALGIPHGDTYKRGKRTSTAQNSAGGKTQASEMSSAQPAAATQPAVSPVWEFEVVSRTQSIAKPVALHLPPIYFRSYINDPDAETSVNNNKVLSSIIELFNTNVKCRIRVEGHANPTTNPGNANGRRREQIRELLPLSKERARAVVNKLVELGADPDRLEFHGLGGENPVASFEDRNNWWKNRRVEFVIIE